VEEEIGMRRYAFAVAVMAALLLAGTAAWAQAPGPGAVAQGFTVETLLAQISLYLPPESTQGLGGFGRGFGGQGGGQAGGQGGAQGSGQGSAQGTTTQGAGGQGARSFRQLFQYTRDPKLYLTREQIAKLIPILQDLRANPLPTPSKAKAVQASVDALLSVAQKAEYADYQKQMQKAIDEIRKQFAAAGGGQAGSTGGQGGTSGQGGTGQAGGGQAGAVGGQGGRQGAQLTPTERRQRELDAFIKVLQDRQKQVSA
jgi:hypothetical protein